MEGGWQVEHHCPQCGAPVILEETDRILACAYCRVRFFIAGGKILRYYLSPRRTEGVPDLVFFPYWRFRGMAFSACEAEIEGRLLDISLRASGSRLFPATLGVRPQVLKLRYVVPGLPGRFGAPDLPFEAASRAADESRVCPGPLHSVPDTLLRSFIGEALSLIYAPFLVRDSSILDAVQEQPVGRMSENPGDFPQRFEPPAEHVRFIPTQCPRCGWDLQGEKETLVLSCRNCNSVWRESESALESVEFAVSPSKDLSAVYLPFWRMRVAVEGFELESYADLVRFANLPRAIQAGWKERRLHFLVPAFKVQPLLFLKIARTFTLLQMEQPPEGNLPETPIYPATLPSSEAFESLKMLLASMGVPKKLVLPRLQQTSLKLEHCSILYVPFLEKGEECIHPDAQVSVARNALKWGKMI